MSRESQAVQAARRLFRALENELVSNWVLLLKLKLCKFILFLNPLSDNPTKWSNTLKQFVDNLPTNCLSVFDHFVGLALKGLTKQMMKYYVKPGHCIPSIRRSYIVLVFSVATTFFCLPFLTLTLCKHTRALDRNG